MLSYRFSTVNVYHWEIKSVLSYSKPHTFSTFVGEEKEKNMQNHVTKTKRQNAENLNDVINRY